MVEVFLCYGGGVVDYDVFFGDLGLFDLDGVIWCIYVDFFGMLVGGLVVLML